MSVEVKICGITEAQHAVAAAEAGASHLGFIFFPPSPRHMKFDIIEKLEPSLPKGPERVGVFVGADHAAMQVAADTLKLDMIQLHGKETPMEAAIIKERLGLPVMKAIAVSNEADLKKADPFLPYVDRILFDAKPPKGAELPGGNAVSFPWHILKGKELAYKWMMAGGLTPENAIEAIEASGASALDVSSGVETKPGKKSIKRIEAFLQAVKAAK